MQTNVTNISTNSYPIFSYFSFCQGANASQADSLKTQVNKKTMDTSKVKKIIKATRNLIEEK